MEPTGGKISEFTKLIVFEKKAEFGDFNFFGEMEDSR
jgi:hypothetical protein